MFEIEPDYNVWKSFIKLVCLLMVIYVWSRLSNKWLNK